MPKLVALCNVPFGVGVRAKGEVFDATEQEARVLRALRRAELYVEAAPAPPAEPIKPPEPVVGDAPEAEQAQADPDPAADAVDRTKGKKGTYSRRDLSAQD